MFTGALFVSSVVPLTCSHFASAPSTYGLFPCTNEKRSPFEEEEEGTGGGNDRVMTDKNDPLDRGERRGTVVAEKEGEG